MSDNAKRDDSSADEPISKRAYSPPLLVKWGTMHDITQSVGWNGRKDGGRGKPPKRTR